MKHTLSLLNNKRKQLQMLRLDNCFHASFLARSATAILLSVLLTACATAPASHREDAWFSQDKYAHFVLSGITSAVVAKAAKEDGKDNCDAALIGFTVTLSLGAAKESYDKRRKKTLYSYHDMSWNLLGSTLGSLAGSNCR